METNFNNKLLSNYQCSTNMNNIIITTEVVNTYFFPFFSFIYLFIFINLWYLRISLLSINWFWNINCCLLDNFENFTDIHCELTVTRLVTVSMSNILSSTRCEKQSWFPFHDEAHVIYQMVPRRVLLVLH